ncbi:MAG: filamentous hemagglutinin N-terminal domain-containing protein, partial [Rhodanobacter sp.]
MEKINKKSNVPSSSLKIKPLAATIAMLMVAGPAGAVTAGNVAAGNGTISQNGGNTTINQSSDKLIVNWNDFDIGANDHVQINQPNAKSAILNRVMSSKGTQIDGSLDANGRVFVINPNGIAVGKSGTINANGVVLSTLDVGDQQFMNANTDSNSALNFSTKVGMARAAVVNDGTITAGAGGISLMGGQVVNGANGSLSVVASADSVSSVNLVAAEAVNTNVSTNGNLRVGMTTNDGYGDAGLSVLTANDGKIQTDNADVLLNATTSTSAKGEALRNTGSIDANGAASPFRSGSNVDIRTDSLNATTHIGGTVTGSGDVNVSAIDHVLVDGAITAGGDAVVRATDRNLLGDIVVADGASIKGSNVRLLANNDLTVNGDAIAKNDLSVSATHTLEIGKDAQFAAGGVEFVAGGSVIDHRSATPPVDPVPPPVDPVPPPVDPVPPPVDPVPPPVDPVPPPASGPKGGTVAAGAGTIDQSGKNTTINQSTDKLVVNWNDFDIAADEHVQINQPGKTSAILNRVQSATGTQIDGSLDANGRVFVINPNGIVVGKTGTINANGVVLSTMDITDNSFMSAGSNPNDRLIFVARKRAAVVNEGAIAAGDAGVSLFGGQVANAASGSITSNAQVGLYSGDSVQASINPDGGLTNVVINRDNSYNSSVLSSVTNNGHIETTSGDVSLAAGASSNGSSNVANVSNTGTIKAGGNGLVSFQGDTENRNLELGGDIEGSFIRASGVGNIQVDGRLAARNGISLTPQFSVGVIDIGKDAQLDAGAGALQLSGIVRDHRDPVTPVDPPVTPVDPPVTPVDPPVTPVDPPVAPVDPVNPPAPGKVGTIAAGAGSIDQSGKNTSINQSTDKLVVNWNDFDIAADEHVQINQPGKTSAILNRVQSATGTQIDGSLDANGRVFV